MEQRVFNNNNSRILENTGFIGDQELPKSTKAVIRYETSSSEPGLTGFQDLKPANPEIQARYDAMSPNWNGITGADPSVYRSVARSEYAPINPK